MNTTASSSDVQQDAATGQRDEPATEPPPAPHNLLAVATIFLLGLSLMILRVTPGPVANWLDLHGSFENLPLETQLHIDDLLLVPAASVLVVLSRLTLGLRMLGPFRPILIALAFYQTGVLAGAVFMVVVLVVVGVIRPRLQRGLLPYFGRLSVLLACVVLLELLALLLGNHFRSDDLLQAAVFPIVVLCLSADGFARVMAKDGTRQAIHRGTVTLLIAIAISVLGGIPEVARFLFQFPEFVLIEIAALLVISTHMKWDLLGKLLPGDEMAPM